MCGEMSFYALLFKQQAEALQPAISQVFLTGTAQNECAAGEGADTVYAAHVSDKERKHMIL